MKACSHNFSERFSQSLSPKSAECPTQLLRDEDVVLESSLAKVPINLINLINMCQCISHLFDF